MWAACYPLFLHMFAAYEPSHRCFVPSCDSTDSQLNESHIQFSIPNKESSDNMFTEAEYFDPCKQFDIVTSSMENVQDTLMCSEELFDQVIFLFQTEYKTNITFSEFTMNLMSKQNPFWSKRQLFKTDNIFAF